MQKLKKSIQKKFKKSLKNNLLSLNAQTSCFVLTNVSQKDVVYKVQSLTSNTMKKLGLEHTLDTSILKFPLSLQTFQNSSLLKKKMIERNCGPIIVRANNLILKNKAYQILIQQNIYSQVAKMKRTTFGLASLLLVLRFHLKRIENKE